jgi:hypothetical protein
MTMGGAPIRFRDRNGVEWTVTRRASGDLVELEFLSESGERRAATVVPIDERAWAEVAEHAWQVLLQQADPD